MTDVILKSQEKKINKNTLYVNPFEVKKLISSTSPISKEWIVLNDLNNATFAQESRWELPTGYIKNIVFKITMTVATSGTAETIAWSCPDNLTLLSGQNVIERWDDCGAVFASFKSLLSNNALLQQAETLAGGIVADISAATMIGYTVLPLFFSDYSFSKFSENTPLNTNGLKQKMVLKVLNRSFATLTKTGAVGASALTNQLYVEMWNNLDNNNNFENYTYQAIRPQIFTTATLATATAATNIDLSSLTGKLDSIDFIPRLTTRTGVQSAVSSTLDQLKLVVDGRTIFDFSTNNETNELQILNFAEKIGFGLSSSIASISPANLEHMINVSFGVSRNLNSGLDFGHLDMSKITDFRLNWRQSSGSAQQLTAVGFQHVSVVLKNGFFVIEQY